MGKFVDHIPEPLLKWAREQAMFWVATAPLSPNGHVNLSPKGAKQSYTQIDSKRMVYEDLSGSGIETISHLRENKRITVLFHAFEGPPRLCRLFGTGFYHEFGTPEYDQYIPPEKRTSGSRAVIVIDIEKVGTSCGFGIPLYQYLKDRPTLQNWSSVLEKPTALPQKTMRDWWIRENSNSIDGLPGLEVAQFTEGPFKNTWVQPDTKKKVDKNALEDDRKAKKAGASQPAAQQLAQLKNPSNWLEDRLFIGIVVGILVSTMMSYVGVPLI